jgi:hypothetical protein
VPDTPGASPGSDQLTEVLHELMERLTAVVNYSAAARRLVDHDPRGDGATLGEILDNLSDQAERAAGLVRRLRGLLAAVYPDPRDRNTPNA